jgi:formyltetrahydrofolate-dependent phosphoribosylglycinamide formyltransferase
LERIGAGLLPAEVVTVVASCPDAGGLQIASEAHVPSAVFEKRKEQSVAEYSRAIFDHCRQFAPGLIVMAGFLKLVEIPDDFVGRVVNIHPSLIPAFCGKGFYGHHVHEAVLKYGAKVSGCTVHFVDNQYDHGPIISQRVVEVDENDTPDELAARVFRAECEAYPAAIRAIAEGRVRIDGRQVHITRG